MTVVQHILLDAAQVPRSSVPVRARLVGGGYLASNAEIGAPAETRTDPAGLFAFDLIPSGDLTPAGVYEITWPGARRTIIVPATGPVWLNDL